MSESLSEQDRLQVAAEYAAASRDNDAVRLAALSSPGAVTWHNFDEQEVTTEESARTAAWLHRTVPDIAWTDVAVRTTSDGFVWQSLLTGTAPGGPLRAHSCIVVTLDDQGKIVRADEYLDTAQIAVLRA